MSTTSSFQKKQINNEIERAINSGFSIDTSNDQNFLTDSTYQWDDLNNLKDSLGNSVLEFMGQVNTIITNPEVIANLGERKNHFNQLINIFFSDISEFSHKVKHLREQHEHLTGRITDINQFNAYNRIAIQYQALYTELHALITPTLSDLVVTISEIIPMAQNNTQQEG